MRAGGRLALLVAVVLAGPASCVTGPGDEEPAAPVGPPEGARLREVDGGADYYRRWPRSLPADPGFFPVGVWLATVHSPADAAADAATGINTYVGLTEDSDLRAIAARGMWVVPQWDDWVDRVREPGAEAIAGWLLHDEVDMTEGPDRGAAVLEDVLRRLPPDDGRLRYNNYGKGVLFWHDDPAAARFVNRFQDVVSADAYWFTDPQLCNPSEGGVRWGGRALTAAECHRADNYGATVERVRSLVEPAGSKPVWAFVEVGHPGSEDDWPTITPDQVTAAVWSSIIHGARGIVYFNHSFAGPAPTHQVLRDPRYADVRVAVAETNRRLHALAPVLNAPFVEGAEVVQGEVDLMVKYHEGSLYAVVASTADGRQEAVFRIPCAGPGDARVVDEARTAPADRGVVRDTFSHRGVAHVYRLPAAARCDSPA